MMIQPISALQLYDLPIEDSEFAADLHPGLEKARKPHPWLARFSHGYIKRDPSAFPGVWGIRSLPIRFTPAQIDKTTASTVGAQS